MRLGNADLDRQAGSSKCVLTRGAGAAVVARERDDVGSGFGDADRDYADIGHDRDLDRDARARLGQGPGRDRKSTRLNSSHSQISYAVFCLKKKKTQTKYERDL